MALTWGIVVSVCVAIGFAFGFAACWFWERKQDEAALQRIKHDQVVIQEFDSPRAETPVQRGTQLAREVVKEVVPSGSAFGKLKYEDVGEMFLDNFLLKYFHEIMIPPDFPNPGPTTQHEMRGKGPWERFCTVNPWAKGLPELFWLMTGYRPDEYQLNQAISEYSRRVSKV